MNTKMPVIDLDDMPEITDFSKGRKNPFAERIKREGYAIRIEYKPEDIARMTGDELCSLDLEEKKVLAMYNAANGFDT